LGCGNEFLFPHLFIDFAKVPKKFFQRIRSRNDDVFSSFVKVSFNLGTLRHTLFKRDSGIRSSHFNSRLFTMNGHSCSISQSCASVSERKATSISVVPPNSRLLVYSHYNRQLSQRSGKYSLSSQTSYNRLPPRFAFSSSIKIYTPLKKYQGTLSVISQKNDPVFFAI